MKRIYFIGGLLIVFFWLGCSKEGRLDFIDEDLPAPLNVSNVKVSPTPGGAVLTYKLPSDPNLSYIKAVYEIQPGVFREAKSSRYTDTLRLVGFGDTLKHAVKVFSVGKNEKVSEPISVDVIPRTPAVRSVFATADFSSTFGGVSISFKNPDKAELSIVIMRDSTGNNTWTKVATFYTAAVAGNFAARGLESEPQKFAMFVRDRWNNRSDTLFKTLTPKFEVEIPKTTWTALVLPTDQTALAEPGFVLSNLWNKVIGIPGTGANYASSNSSTLPQWFTIDLGKKVLMSRFKMFMDAADGHCYVGSGVKRFELWGSNSPDTDGGWTQWQLLGTFETFKPSGLPLGQATAEDTNYASILGCDYGFDNQPPAVRYLRWKTLETYASPGQVVIAEISLWGQVEP
ncbi:DUF5000 domain-containing lipoprotein [Arcticibacter tournemirensis]|uniref:DUF5126 domain-containing protein n=1 Tax=Arcticibacter tournemirensis TaxID=699437 RepID=A0A4Q0MFG6_9SPHI|nr:DUF5000 domain-containing lipoprotein [Arcticibacter tournemirensis]RXF71699.1 DUF5126 domain-containing protein [Arcticibacter tournemirensis]